MNRTRRIAALVHRYTGLSIASFLVVVGLSGAIISWNDQLERVFAPSLFVLSSDAQRRPPLDVFVLREAAERQTGFAVNGVDWTRRSDAPAFFSVEARPGGPEPHDNEIALDPSTGRIVGARRHGDLRQGAINLLPFIYDLHESLALGATGTLVLGIVALIWTIDCFVGAYLTFPAKGAPRRGARKFLGRWAPAWLVRWRGGPFKLFYDLHRAGGLWPWALMLIIAWSSVSLNLPLVYDPVISSVMGVEETGRRAAAADPLSSPKLDWRAAHATGMRLMTKVGRREGFTTISERLMFFDPNTHAYAYRVLSTHDVGTLGNTQIRFDGDTGGLLGVSVPTGRAAGTTFTTWVVDIHTGEVLGIAMRVILSLTGLATASLSVTGVWLWWRKSRSRIVVGAKRRRRPI